MQWWRFLAAGLMLLTGCSDFEEQRQEQIRISELSLKLDSPKVLLIHDSADRATSGCYLQAKKTLAYGKIVAQELDLATAMALPELEKFCSLVTATENLWKLQKPECEQISEFVSQGGGLVVLVRGWNQNLSELFGVKNRAEPGLNNSAQTINFVTEFFPGGQDLKVEKEVVSNLGFELMDGTVLVAKTDKYPIVWLNYYGRGRMLYWNTVLLDQKINRGFITRSIGAVQPFTSVVLANIGLFDLDGYPCATSNVKIDPVKTEFNQTNPEFYVQHWYPDMRVLAERYRLKYTSLVIFNDNVQNLPPFLFYDWLNGEIRYAGKKMHVSPYSAKILSAETELGLHGYNPLPLTSANWGGTNNMVLALQAVKQRWEVDNLGVLPMSYVPPLNVYDSTGVEALLQVLPSIEQIGALYEGEFAAGQDREFGPEPWNENLYVLPRITFGYRLTEFSKRAMISILASNGIWAHAVQPYPGTEPSKTAESDGEQFSQLSWRGEPKKNGCYYQLEHWLDFATEHYPWLRFVTRREAGEIMKYYDQTLLNSSLQGNIINLEVNVVPSYFTIYLQEKNKLEGSIGCELLFQYQTELGSQFVFKATENIMLLNFEKQILPKGD